MGFKTRLMLYFIFKIYSFIYFWLYWVLVAAYVLLSDWGTLSCPAACGILVPQSGIRPM